MSHPTHATRAEIDLSAFRHNLDAVTSYTGPDIKVMAVVKANAYGHGSVRLSEEAVRHGVEYLAVARFHEGVELREAGIRHPIALFELLQDDHLLPSIEYGMELTLVSVDGARRVNQVARHAGKIARVHVKVDTGMGRLGVLHSEAAEVVETIARLSSIELVGVYSHFATSEESDQSFAKLQLSRFQDLLLELDRRKVEIPLRHMANSGAIISLPDAHFDMVRPGIMLYGYPPGKGMPQRYPVRPVMSLKSRVASIKTVGAKTSVSYGRRYFTRVETVIATIPIGYADGYARVLTNKSRALIRGRAYPVVGTVTMDQVMVDVGPHGDVREGDAATLIGRDGEELITAWDIAELAETIPYEVTCLITPRVPRVYSPAG
ncbi:MAG: alanine racemase [Bacteroidota bacterium]|jgi:alanine racemase